VLILLEFLQNPSLTHIAIVDRILEYLVGMKYLAIEYNSKCNNKNIFIASSDSAFADDNITRHSSYGFYFSLFGRVIYYKVVKGSTVTTSSTKAELLALSITAKEAILLTDTI
jgi:hypothetical protein